MNLTQLEWIKTELKQRFYGLNKTSGKTVNRWKRILDLTEKLCFQKKKTYFESNRGILRFLKEKTYFESTRKKLRFRNRKTYSESALWTAGYITWKCMCSFANKPGEGVRAILDCWIESRWPRLERRGRESRQPKKKTDTAEPHCRQRKTPRSAWFGPRGHGLTSREHRE